MKHYLIYYCIKIIKLNITGKILSNLFKDIYGEIKLDYSKLTIKQKEKYIKIYKKNNKIQYENEVKLEESLNLDIIANSAARYLINYRKKRKFT